MSVTEEPITEAQVAAAQAESESTEGEPGTGDVAEPGEPGDDPERNGGQPPDDDPEADPEAAHEPPPPQVPVGPSDAIMESRYKKADTAAKRYASTIGGIFEEQAADLIPCPCCSSSGHPAFVNVHDAGRIPEPVKATVMAFLGLATEQDYEQDSDTRTCPKCQGAGKTKTGSKVPGNEAHKCNNCVGYGFVPPPTAGSELTPVASTSPLPAGEHVAPLATADVDPTGEPKILPDGRENPNFGKWPQFKIPVDPWGTTAGLTAQDA